MLSRYIRVRRKNPATVTNDMVEIVCETFSCTNKLSNYAYNWSLFCVTLFNPFPFIVVLFPTLLPYFLWL